MRQFLTGVVILVVAAGAPPLFMDRSGLNVWLPGSCLLLVLLVSVWQLKHDARAPLAEPPADDREESLRRWLMRTDALIKWSESSRSDWDRHLRPMLARQFEMAAGQRKSKDPSAFHAAGEMAFGAELWEWVAPDNGGRTGGEARGPGRAALSEILQRLEQL